MRALAPSGRGAYNRIDDIVYALRRDKVLGFLVSHAQITEVDKLTQQGTALPETPPHVHAHDHGEPGHVHGPDRDH